MVEGMKRRVSLVRLGRKLSRVFSGGATKTMGKSGVEDEEKKESISRGSQIKSDSVTRLKMMKRCESECSTMRITHQFNPNSNNSNSGYDQSLPFPQNLKLFQQTPSTTTTHPTPSSTTVTPTPSIKSTTLPSHKSASINLMSLHPSPSPSPSPSISPSPSPSLSPSPSPSISPSPSPSPSPLKLPSTLSVPLPLRPHSSSPHLSPSPHALPPALTLVPPLSPDSSLINLPSLLTPRQHSSPLRPSTNSSDSPLLASQPTLSPTLPTLLNPCPTHSSPPGLLFPNSSSTLPSPLVANLGRLELAPATLHNPPSSRSSTPSASTPPITARQPTLAIDALSISGSSTRASPVRIPPNPSSTSALTSSLATKLGHTTKLDVMAVKPSDPQMKSPVHPERKSMFGKLFEKRNGDATKDIKSTLPSGQLASAPSTDAGSGNESETILANSNKKSMMGRKPSHTTKKSSDAVVSTTTAPLHHSAETNPSAAANGVMGILSRQASTCNAATNGGGGPSAPATKLLLSVNGHKATSDKSVGGADEAKVVSSSSKLRDMVGGKLGRKPSSSKPPRSEDGRLGEEVHIGDSKSMKGSQATSTLLKKYGVCEKAAIGKGATAVVRLVHKWDRGTDKLYAVKEFRKRRKNESEKEYVKKLTSEFCISSTLHHENIVETVDLVQDENKNWCEVMEYCPGGDLYAAIKRGSMSQAAIHSYFKQIILGVDYLHRMGVAHRDIKPENLLLDCKGQIKITDFGVSDVFRMCWEKTTHLSKGLCGSEPYLPKEMFERKEYDARLVDVWACAVVYYCCCMQELPWRVAKKNDPSFQTYLQAFETGSNSPPPITNLQRESRFIIKKMWSPEPENRIFIDQVLVDPWVASLVVLTADGVNGTTTTSTLSGSNNIPITTNVATAAVVAATVIS